MKKRNQDGYVLVFVLVVVLVVLALCGAACTAALRNLKSQQASIEDLQSKLGAAGKVEEIYGRLVNLSLNDLPTLKDTKNGSVTETAGAAAAAFESDIYSILKDTTIKAVSPYSLQADTKILNLEYEINVSTTGDDSNTHVDATLKLEATLRGEDPSITVTPDPTVSPAPESVEKKYTTWTLQDVKVSYDSYHVSTTESEGDSP